MTRSYRQAMELRVLDDLGAAKLSDIGRADLQDLADRLLAKGLDSSTVRNALMPVRVIYRRALSRGEVALNPCAGLELPAGRGTRDRIASPTEAAALVEALPESDRPCGRPRSTGAFGAASCSRWSGGTWTSLRA